MQPNPMAASAAVAGVLTGHRRRVEVAAATPHAIYLATGDPECPALCLVSRCAVRVPCALLVPALPTAVDGTVGGGGPRAPAAWLPTGSAPSWTSFPDGYGRSRPIRACSGTAKA
ncbi:MAG TPA: hypothetical protein VFE14_11900 [Micromonosporaceae bacterium]|nr:hypothetical protein [Micromonosporaceae bacterium]